ncbi:MAG: PEP-CTERM sorting domain-containing protein [Candidatus Omnitrophota bacterium]
MKKLLIASLILSIGLVAGAGKALALPVTISLDAIYDWGTSYALAGSTWTAATSNPYFPAGAGQPQGFTDGVQKAADGLEDSYGIFRVNTMKVGTTKIFDRATSAFELTGMFYGFDDIYLNGTMSNATIFSVGGSVDLYQDYAKNYSDTSPFGPQSTGTGGGRYDINAGQGDGFLLATDGTNVLNLTPRLLTDGNTGIQYTLRSVFDFNSTSGSGSMVLDVAGGSWGPFWDTDTLPEPNGDADMLLDYTSVNTGPNGWLIEAGGTARGNIVPEPASMAIFGIGLLGVGARFRKKRLA